jgi:DNA-binding response OmpR family regulator
MIKERTALVVDDEDGIRKVLRAYLESDGFNVVEAATGAAALEALATQALSVVLLDIGLPDVDGIEVLRQIRSKCELPVLLVTARTEEVDTLVGLSVGADDYITKPFSPREVVARVKTVLRRSAPASAADPDVLRFGELVIDLPGRTVTLADQPVTFSALQFDLLAALAATPGRVFSRAQLLEQVWGYSVYGDERLVDVHLAQSANSWVTTRQTHAMSPQCAVWVTNS